MKKQSNEDKAKAEQAFIESGGDILMLQKALGHKHIRSTMDYVIRKRLVLKLSEIRKA